MRVVKSHSIFLHVVSYSCYEIGENDIEDKWLKQKKRSTNTFTVGDLTMSHVLGLVLNLYIMLYLNYMYNIIIM